jgi:hypothetical protein
MTDACAVSDADVTCYRVMAQDAAAGDAGQLAADGAEAEAAAGLWRPGSDKRRARAYPGALGPRRRRTGSGDMTAALAAGSGHSLSSRPGGYPAGSPSAACRPRVCGSGLRGGAMSCRGRSGADAAAGQVRPAMMPAPAVRRQSPAIGPGCDVACAGPGRLANRGRGCSPARSVGWAAVTRRRRP